jgi:hypothetical protein
VPNSKVFNYNGKYRIIELEKARKHLINRLYDSNHKNEFEKTTHEIILKRKLGIYSQDVLDFYKKGIMPKCISLDKNLNNTNDEDFIIDDTVVKEISKSDDNINQDNSLKNVPLDIEQTHICDEVLMFCPKNIGLFNEISDEFSKKNLSIIFLCDSCKTLMNLEDNMVKHLNEKQHISASIYCYNEDKEFYLHSRCKIKNLDYRSLEMCVFCLKFYFYFGSNILACCLHFKYVHKQHNNNELVYSVSNLPIKVIDIDLSREYKCLTCFLKFKKLTDFTYHLENTKHFPFAENENLINVFFCPIEECQFRSIVYSAFKIHILTHPYVQKIFDNQKNDEKFTAKVKVYEKPKYFFHVRKFNGKLYSDKIDELDGIESLLEILKGHADQNECVKKLKARKDEIYKNRR